MDTSVGGSASARRSLLKRGVLFAAGAIGLGLGRTANAQATQPEAPVVPVPVTDATNPGHSRIIELDGRNWHLKIAGRKRGEQPVGGDQLTTFGELFSGPDGEKVGEFYATGTYLAYPLGFGPLGAATSEVHTFRFADGTIVGMGTGSFDESVFAIIGGTGRFAGASGSYVVTQSHSELGGDGTAAFRLTIAV